MPRTTFLEGLHDLAKIRAAARGISYGAAYQQILSENPFLYENALKERADAGLPGTSGAKLYARHVQRLQAEPITRLG